MLAEHGIRKRAITEPLNWIHWINQTISKFPDGINRETIALLQIVGINTKPNRRPNYAEDMIASVVGETKLFMQSCYIISLIALMPIPVHKIACSWDSQEIRMSSIRLL